MHICAIKACTYGPPPVANMMWEAIKQSFSVIPGANFYTREECTLPVIFMLSPAKIQYRST